MSDTLPSYTKWICPLCQNKGKMLVRSARLMGATYLEGDSYKGDEHFVPCPLCCGVKALRALVEGKAQEKGER